MPDEVSEGERGCKSPPGHGSVPGQSELLPDSWCGPVRRSHQGSDRLVLSCFQNSGGDLVPKMLLSKVREKHEGLRGKESVAQQPPQPAFCPVFPAKGKCFGFLLPAVNIPSCFHAILGQQKAVSISSYNGRCAWWWWGLGLSDTLFKGNSEIPNWIAQSSHHCYPSPAQVETFHSKTQSGNTESKLRNLDNKIFMSLCFGAL